MKIVAIALIAAGVAALVYRGFEYTRRHDVELGPIDVQYDAPERVEIPVWAGVLAVGAGTVLLLRRRTA